MMERCRPQSGYSVQKIICGMKDSVQVEAVSNQSGDVPNQSGGLLETLPEAPTIEVEGKTLEVKTEESGS